MTVIIHSHNCSGTSKRKKNIPLFDFAISDPQKPSAKGIIPKLQGRASNDETWVFDVLDAHIDMQLIVPIYCASVNRLQLMLAFKNMNLAQIIKDIHKFEHFKVLSDMTCCGQPFIELIEQLSNYGLVLSESAKDGNCFFNSVATNVMCSACSWEGVLKELGIMNKDSHDIPEDLQTRLREHFVAEIMGERKYEYKQFITMDRYDAEAQKFSVDGYYNSEMGDLMPLAMANLLQSHIIIFTVNAQKPFYVSPNNNQQDRAIFLVYDPRGSGHCNAAIPYAASKNTKHSHNDIKCNCGVNATDMNAMTCCLRPRYACRCKCFKFGMPCSSLCRCKNCGNPKGSRSLVGQQSSSTRKRRSHELQTMVPSSKKFALERKEEINETVWSTFEIIVLHEVVKCVSISMNEISMHKVYNDVVYYASSPFSMYFLPKDIIFREKSDKQIHAKLHHIGLLQVLKEAHHKL